MCGFVTFINHGNEDLLNNSVKLLKHRGPDNQSIFWDDKHKSGIGHRRLSIIDLSIEGNQPFWSEDRKTAVVFNGEIFNFLELKDTLIKKGVNFRTSSDTEVLINGYKVFGENIIHQLNGMFSFVIYDLSTGNIFCARDHMGIKPFYYHHKNNSIIIASELKAIISALGYAEPDYSAIVTPMHFQTAPNTGFKNIKKLLPGHTLSFENNNLKIKEYWSLKSFKPEISNSKKHEQKLDELLNDSVSKQMISDVPVGVLLSGGIDSSLIAALMSKNTKQTITSFNIRITEKDLIGQGIVDDSVYAKQVANYFNFNHKEIIIEPQIIDLLPKLIYHLEELTIDPAAINTFLISKAAKDSGITVLLSGIGADEIFSGYRIHHVLNNIEKYKLLTNNKTTKRIAGILSKLPIKNRLISKKYTRWIKKIFYLISLDNHTRHILAKDSSLSTSLHSRLFNKDFEYSRLNHIQREYSLFYDSHNYSYLNKLCLSDASIYLPDHNLQYLDKASMAAGIEARPPLIDKRIVEFAFKLSDNQKIKHNIQKYLIKKVAKKYLKSNIINRPKAPFAAPLRSWLENDLKEMIFDTLTSKKTMEREIFNIGTVNFILDNHYKGKEDHSQLIFRLLMTEIWFNTFIDKN